VHQPAALAARGVTTLAGLAALPIAQPVVGIGANPFRRVREQARTQLAGRTAPPPLQRARTPRPRPSAVRRGMDPPRPRHRRHRRNRDPGLVHFS